MEGQILNILKEKLANGLAAEPPSLTRREIRVPAVPGKAMAVIGMRRSGKTCFLWQCISPNSAFGLFNYEATRKTPKTIGKRLRPPALPCFMERPGLTRPC